MQWIKFEIEILRSRRSLAVVVGMKKTNGQAEPTKCRTTKNNTSNNKIVNMKKAKLYSKDECRLN